MKTKNVYIITQFTSLMGGDAETKILGVYSSAMSAQKAFTNFGQKANEWVDENTNCNENERLTVVAGGQWCNFAMYGDYKIEINITKHPVLS